MGAAFLLHDGLDFVVYERSFMGPHDSCKKFVPLSLGECLHKIDLLEGEGG